MIPTPHTLSHPPDACPHCGGALKRIEIEVMGRRSSVICWGSCGCERSALDGRVPTPRERAYADAGVPARFAAVGANVADWPRRVAAGEQPWVLGGNGSGKSAWAAALVRALVDMGVRARFENVSSLLDAERRSFDGGGGGRLARARACDVLVLDDLGKEQASDWSVATLFELIDARYRAERPTVVTSNFNRAQIARRMGERDRSAAMAIASRLSERSQLIDMDGSDRRLAQQPPGRRPA